jgi:hypothetical protein
MDPKPVPGLQVGHFRNRDRHACTLHVHLKFRPDQIKGGVVGASGQSKKEHRRET